MFSGRGSLAKRTDYIGEFVYEDGELAFMHGSEGRLLPGINEHLLTENRPGHPQSEEGRFKYEYHYKDQLGNLRLAFREETATVFATMETSYSEKEALYFENLSETRLVDHSKARAYSGVASAQTNGNNAQRSMGPATVVKVKKGDEVSISLKSLYESSGIDYSVRSMPSLGSVFASALGDLALGTQFATEAGVQMLPQFTNSSNRPRAYARIVLLDKNGNEISGNDQKMLVPTGANAWKSLSLTLEANQAGYAVIYVANESKMDVFFDDVEVSHERLVWQENAYYPFGLGIKPLEREGAPGFMFTYNGGSELERMTKWHETPFRPYDSQIGRFHQVDKLAEIAYNKTSYYYANNNPVSYKDATGLCPDCKTWDDVINAINNDPSSLDAGTYLNDENGGFVHTTGIVIPGVDIIAGTGKVTMTNPFQLEEDAGVAKASVGGGVSALIDYAAEVKQEAKYGLYMGKVALQGAKVLTGRKIRRLRTQKARYQHMARSSKYISQQRLQYRNIAKRLKRTLARTGNYSQAMKAISKRMLVAGMAFSAVDIADNAMAIANGEISAEEGVFNIGMNVADIGVGYAAFAVAAASPAAPFVVAGAAIWFTVRAFGGTEIIKEAILD